MSSCAQKEFKIAKIQCKECEKFITRGNIARHLKGENCQKSVEKAEPQKIQCEKCKKFISKPNFSRHQNGFNCEKATSPIEKFKSRKRVRFEIDENVSNTTKVKVLIRDVCTFKIRSSFH